MAVVEHRTGCDDIRDDLDKRMFRLHYHLLEESKLSEEPADELFKQAKSKPRGIVERASLAPWDGFRLRQQI
jgi:hypothetical protein